MKRIKIHVEEIFNYWNSKIVQNLLIEFEFCKCYNFQLYFKLQNSYTSSSVKRNIREILDQKEMGDKTVYLGNLLTFNWKK